MSPGNCFQIWPIWSNDYARKTRIEIQCKKTCPTAPNLFSKSHLLSNSCGYRTFARMSTWAINKYSRSIGLIKYHVNKYPRMGYVRMHIWWFQKIDVEMTNCHLLNQYKWFAWMFIDFRIPKPFVSVSELPAALRRPQKKTRPGCCEHAFYIFCDF